MKRVFIAVGSNLSEPVRQAEVAINALRLLPKSQFVKASSLYSSKPMGPQEQPDYINAVVEIETLLSPIELLDCTQQIENAQGRTRKTERWGSRTLDLDILLYGDEIIESDRLTIPHYGMKVREFVLYPLSELAPKLQLPDGTVLNELVMQVPLNGLTVYK